MSGPLDSVVLRDILCDARGGERGGQVHTWC